MGRNTQILLDANNARSMRKRQQTLRTISRLADAGARISFARVAREAGVSTWLVYNVPQIREALKAAITTQTEHGYQPPHRQPSGSVVSSASLRTDLALARHELKQTRADRDSLRRRVERVLGDDIRETDRQQLVDRITDLEGLLRGSHASHGALSQTAADLTERCSELTEQLEAARRLNQTMVRQHNAAGDVAAVSPSRVR